MTNTTLDIVIAADDNYIEYAVICIKSLVETNRNYGTIVVHLLSNRLSNDSVEILRSVLRKEDSLKVYPVGNLEKRLKVEIPDTISITSYARLFVCGLLPKDVDRVMYVDCDIIFNDDISAFYDADLDDNLVGGILDTFTSYRAKRSIGIKDDEPYLNAGVLLIPLKRWREDNLEDQFLFFLLKYGGDVYHHDQGIINAVCVGRKRVLPLRYNVSSFYFSHPYRLLKKYNTPFYSRQACDEAVSHPAVIHYTSGVVNRPWVAHCKHPLADVFHQYKSRTIYRNTPLRPDARTRIERVDSWLFLKSPWWFYRFFVLVRKTQYKVRRLFRLSGEV